MKYILVILFFAFSMTVFSAPGQAKASYSKLKFQKEINELVEEFEKENSKNRSFLSKWEKYIEELRGKALKRQKAVDDFIQKSKFYITLKRNTFIKKRGGFEYTPMCVILPVIYDKKIILIGDQLCTSPKMKRLYPLKEFFEDFQEEVKRTESETSELAESFKKIKDEIKEQENLLTQAINMLPEYENDQLKKDKYLELKNLIEVYKTRIHDLKKQLRKQNKVYKKQKDRNSILKTLDKIIKDQIKFYKLSPEFKTENQTVSPLAKRLKELNKLLKDGLITKKDYDKAKQKLLTEIK